jgi:hypothetical protein
MSKRDDVNILCDFADASWLMPATSQDFHLQQA